MFTRAEHDVKFIRRWKSKNGEIASKECQNEKLR